MQLQIPEDSLLKYSFKPLHRLTLNKRLEQKCHTQKGLQGAQVFSVSELYVETLGTISAHTHTHILDKY